MKKLTFQPEHIVMAVVLVLFGAGTTFMAFNLPTGEELSSSGSGKVPEKIAFAELEGLQEKIQKPIQISGVKEEQPVFVSRLIVYYPANGVIEPLDKNKELPGVGITAAWLIKNNLSIEDPEVGNQDPDSDGFSNSEEYVGQTDPQNKESHPAIIAKLRVKKFNDIPLPLEFKGRVQGASGYEFQIAFKGSSKILKPGSEIEGYKLGEYREKIEERYIKAIDQTVKEDVSELDVVFQKLNETITLVLKKPTKSDESTVELVLQVPGGKVEPSTVKRGDQFKVRENTYQLLKAGTDGAVIRDMAEKNPEKVIKVPMLRP